MKVKIGDEVYDAEKIPIMLILTDQDKRNIAAMSPDAQKFCVYPEGLDQDEIEQWMSMPPGEKTGEEKESE